MKNQKVKTKTFINDRVSIDGMVKEFSEREDVDVLAVQTHLDTDHMLIAVVVYKEVPGDGR